MARAALLMTLLGMPLCGSCLVGIDDVDDATGGASGGAGHAGGGGTSGIAAGGGSSGVDAGGASGGLGGAAGMSGAGGAAGSSGGGGGVQVYAQHGSATLSQGMGVAAVSIDPVALDQSVLLFGKQHNELQPVSHHVRGELTATHASFTRVTTAGNVAIDWHVLQHPALRVQRGLLTTSGNQSIIQLAQPVELGKSFAFISQAHTGAYFGDDDVWMVDLAGPTTLRLRAADEEPSDVNWQVVEFLDGSKVLSGITTMPSLGIAAIATLPESVDLARSFVFFSYKLGAITLEITPATAGVRGRLTAADVVTFERTSAGDVSLEIAWFVVELAAAKVHATSLGFAAGALQVEQTLPAFDVARAVPLASWLGMGGKAASTTYGALGEAHAGFTLPGGNKLIGRRGAAESSAEIEAYLLAF